MIDSILNSIKKPLGIDPEYDAFDEDITMHINSVFSTLHSIGASPPTPFMIMGDDEKWSDFFGEIKQAMMVKSYMYLKVKMLFDPPATSFALDAMKNQAQEWEWRLAIMEFVFNPLSRPIDTTLGNQELAKLSEKVEDIDEQLDQLDEEIDSVPDLSNIFNSNMEK